MPADFRLLRRIISPEVREDLGMLDAFHRDPTVELIEHKGGLRLGSLAIDAKRGIG
jgi:hypothetical protein